MIHSLTYDVTFGDCDPAGIAFYPNIFKWMDRGFHDWMRGFGGHAAVCETLGLAGIGLRGAEAEFMRPVLDGMNLTITIATVDWAEKGLSLSYEGLSGDAVHFKGVERRALFVPTDKGIRAGAAEPLRALVESRG